MKKLFSSTLFLIYGVWLVGFVIISGGTAILNGIYSEPNPDFLNGLVIAVGFICMLVNGIVMIKRQEFPRLLDPSITGFWAVVGGWVIVIGAVFWLFYVVLTLVNS